MRPELGDGLRSRSSYQPAGRLAGSGRGIAPGPGFGVGQEITGAAHSSPAGPGADRREWRRAGGGGGAAGGGGWAGGGRRAPRGERHLVDPRTGGWGASRGGLPR